MPKTINIDGISIDAQEFASCWEKRSFPIPALDDYEGAKLISERFDLTPRGEDLIASLPSIPNDPTPEQSNDRKCKSCNGKGEITLFHYPRPCYDCGGTGSGEAGEGSCSWSKQIVGMDVDDAFQNDALNTGKLVVLCFRKPNGELKLDAGIVSGWEKFSSLDHVDIRSLVDDFGHYTFYRNHGESFWQAGELGIVNILSAESEEEHRKAVDKIKDQRKTGVVWHDSIHSVLTFEELSELKTIPAISTPKPSGFPLQNLELGARVRMVSGVSYWDSKFCGQIESISTGVRQTTIDLALSDGSVKSFATERGGAWWFANSNHVGIFKLEVIEANPCREIPLAVDIRKLDEIQTSFVPHKRIESAPYTLNRGPLGTTITFGAYDELRAKELQKNRGY